MTTRVSKIAEERRQTLKPTSTRGDTTMTIEQLAEAENKTIVVKSPVIEFQGKQVMQNSKGGFDPVEVIKPMDTLKDQTVRNIIAYARHMKEKIDRFRGHCLEEIGTLEALLAEEYGAKLGGPKGNITITTYDALMRVEVKNADLIEFGPELQTAKSLLDECMNEWTSDSRPEIRAIITNAFNTDKQGQINRAEIFMLLRLDIDDERWRRAMCAIKDAIHVTGAKTYLRFQFRNSVEEGWQTLPINLAKAT